MQNKYPAVFAHLKTYEDRLRQRGQCRYSASKKRNIAADFPGQHHWLELDNNPSIEKLQDFLKPKIMYSEIVQKPQFYLDEKGEFYPEATTFIISGKDLKYLIELLQDDKIAYIFRLFYAGGGLGEHVFRYKKIFLQNLPLPLYNSKNPIQNKIMYKGSKSNSNLLYQLYNFTEEEIRFLEKEKI